eukprot:TRINITY_DN1030_c0_g2_i7.p1 TRINITY_DN1030_c0_g2~~TRINITY_DN1030_c0_g2_i7.p1  ORF type:complete len:654 (-),score=43.25 TRINITY_DN1030_c0_g2_i7:102-2063(-)
MENDINNTFYQGNHLTLKQFRIVAGMGATAAALSTIGCLFFGLTYLFFQSTLNSKKKRKGTRLVFYFVCCALGRSLGQFTILFYELVQGDDLPTHFGKLVCEVEAYSTNFFDLASFLWSACICIHFHRAIVLDDAYYEKYIKFYHLLSWGIPTLVCFGIYLTNNMESDPEFVPWCWIYSPNMQMAVFYIPLALVIVFNIVMYFLLLRTLRYELEQHSISWLPLGMRYILYLVMFIGCWVFPFVNRIAMYFNYISVYLIGIQSVSMNMWGLLISLLYPLFLNLKFRQQWGQTGKEIISSAKKQKKYILLIILAGLLRGPYFVLNYYLSEGNIIPKQVDPFVVNVARLLVSVLLLFFAILVRPTSRKNFVQNLKNVKLHLHSLWVSILIYGFGTVLYNYSLQIVSIWKDSGSFHFLPMISSLNTFFVYIVMTFLLRLEKIRIFGVLGITFIFFGNISLFTEVLYNFSLVVSLEQPFPWLAVTLSLFGVLLLGIGFIHINSFLVNKYHHLVVIFWSLFYGLFVSCIGGIVTNFPNYQIHMQITVYNLLYITFYSIVVSIIENLVLLVILGKFGPIEASFFTILGPIFLVFYPNYDGRNNSTFDMIADIFGTIMILVGLFLLAIRQFSPRKRRRNFAQSNLEYVGNYSNIYGRINVM